VNGGWGGNVLAWLVYGVFTYSFNSLCMEGAMKKLAIIGMLLCAPVFAQQNEQMTIGEQIIVRQIIAAHETEMLKRQLEVANMRLTYLHMQLEEVQAAQQPKHSRVVRAAKRVLRFARVY